MPVIVSSVVSVYDGDRSEWDTGVAANSHVKTLALIRDKCTDSIRKERNACTLQASASSGSARIPCQPVAEQSHSETAITSTCPSLSNSFIPHLTLLGTTINWTTDINYNWVSYGTAEGFKHSILRTKALFCVFLILHSLYVLCIFF